MILVINAGSSSIKFTVFADTNLSVLHNGEVEQATGTDPTASIQAIISQITNLFSTESLKAVGHRVVHGGNLFYKPTIITPEVYQQLVELTALAPIHQPQNLAAIKIIADMYPKLLQVACFDTGFHTTQLNLAKMYAIPRELTSVGIVRYGFHGLSYEYISSVLPQYLAEKSSKKVIVAHLGNGASMCAMQDLKSVATTMGFSTLEGLMIGSRCGNLDPGVILYLLQHKKYTADAISNLLYKHSGLLGVSNISSDVRELLASKSKYAQEAIDLFCYRAACELSTLVTTLKGCDAIVFTAGIGENSAAIRQKICNWLEWLGVELDLESNQSHASIISKQNSKILVAVIHTDEELMIAKHTVKIAI